MSYIASIATENYLGFEISTPVMLVVATFLFGSDSRRRRNGNGNGGS